MVDPELNRRSPGTTLLLLVEDSAISEISPGSLVIDVLELNSFTNDVV